MRGVLGAVRMIARDELRRRWLALTALGVLLGLVVAMVTGTATLIRRTATAHDRLERASAVPDLQVTSYLRHDPGLADRVAGVPGVSDSWTTVGAVGRIENRASVSYLGLIGDTGGPRELYKPVVVEGRAYDPRSPDEVLLDERAAAWWGFGVGDTITLRLLTQSDYISFDTGFGTPGGPTLNLVVTGLTRTAGENAQQMPVMVTPALAEKLDAVTTVVMLRLEPGPEAMGAATAALRRLGQSLSTDPLAREFPTLQVSRPATDGDARIAATQRVLITGLIVFAAVVGVAGLAASGQAFYRHHALGAGTQHIEAMLGLPTLGRAGARTIAALPAAVVAGTVATAGPLLAGRLEPLGPLAGMEPHPGYAGHTALTCLAAAAGVIATALLAATTAVRAGHRPARLSRARPAGRAARFPGRAGLFPGQSVRFPGRPSAGTGTGTGTGVGVGVGGVGVGVSASPGSGRPVGAVLGRRSSSIRRPISSATHTTRGVVGRRGPLWLWLGTSFALARGQDRPVAARRPPITGTAIGITALIAAATIATSMNRLVDDPHRYGRNADLEVTDARPKIIAQLAEDPRVAAVSMLDVSTATIEIDDQGHALPSPEPEVASGPGDAGPGAIGRGDVAPGEDVTVYALSAKPLPAKPRPAAGTAARTAAGPEVGPDVGWTIFEGARPTRTNQVALGPRTAGHFGLGIGDHLSVATNTGGHAQLQVVGIGVGPVLGGERLGESMLVAPDMLTRIQRTQPMRSALVRAIPETDPATFAATLGTEYEIDTGRAPGEVANLGGMGRLPAMLQTVLAALAVAAAGHAVGTTCRHARRELAILRTLGFTPAQTARIPLVTSCVTTALAVAVAVPLGLLLGRLAWWEIATATGVATSPAVPVSLLVALPPAVILIGLVLAAPPASRAARLLPGALLRRE
ncbi:MULTISPECIES: ABC transporter permease [Parafrankia]|uniref:ABC transporter permease n=1 Tax=Parafrankia TaxID=2994362 RepID=UPI001F610AF7|nr:MULTISPECIES: ABC transporter permease [Parafrankia]